MTNILTLNAGSSSIKFSIYGSGQLQALKADGQIENLGSDNARLTLKYRGETASTDIGPADHHAGVQAILTALEPVLNGRPVGGVGHRIVHGGIKYDAPVVLDDDVLKSLEQFEPFAPLHQPHNLAAVRAAMAAFPDAIQVGCFDTAFHRHHPWVNDTFALPREWYDKGIRRYGFHGLSYQYIAAELERIDPYDKYRNTVVCHLGNGASMCAMRGGVSQASTMGFSALDGLPMGTRCGSIDPGILLYFLQQEGMSPEDIAQLLYTGSGLKGMSGLSNDMRVLEDSDQAAAKEAIDYFVFRIKRELGAMAAILQGISTVVFCGGIGENSATIRARICEGMEWLGIAIDPEANKANAPVISRGAATVRVIPTDEEIVIARAVNAAL